MELYLYIRCDVRRKEGFGWFKVYSRILQDERTPRQREDACVQNNEEYESTRITTNEIPAKNRRMVRGVRLKISTVIPDSDELLLGTTEGVGANNNTMDYWFLR